MIHSVKEVKEWGNPSVLLAEVSSAAAVAPGGDLCEQGETGVVNKGCTLGFVAEDRVLYYTLRRCSLRRSGTFLVSPIMYTSKHISGKACDHFSSLVL